MELTNTTLIMELTNTTLIIELTYTSLTIELTYTTLISTNNLHNEQIYTNLVTHHINYDSYENNNNNSNYK